MTSLQQFAGQHEGAAAILSSPNIANTMAAEMINISREAVEAGFSTTEVSVRRFRAKAKPKTDQAPTLEQLLSLGQSEPLPPRSAKVPAWSVGSEIDMKAGEGVLRTRPVPVAEQTDPEDERILAQFNLSAEHWEIAAYRESRWEQTPGVELSAYRVSVRKKVNSAAGLDPAAVEQILSSYPARPRTRKGSRTLVLGVADLQVGKGTGAADDPGTAGIVDRFGRCVAEVEQRIITEFDGSLQSLVVVLCGDMIDGCVSQGGALPNDIGVSEQVRVVRRLIVHLMGTLAPYAERTVCLTVPGNHDQVRRDRITTARDSWAIEAVSAAADALALDPRFADITWVYPAGSEDISVAVDVDGVIIGAVHGDQINNPNQMKTWLAGQALADMPVGRSNLLFSGHWHHLRIESIAREKTWCQVPTLDNGSPHFKNKRGLDSPSGLISMRLEQSTPWFSGMEFHTGS